MDWFLDGDFIVIVMVICGEGGSGGVKGNLFFRADISKSACYDSRLPYNISKANKNLSV